MTSCRLALSAALFVLTLSTLTACEPSAPIPAAQPIVPVASTHSLDAGLDTAPEPELAEAPIAEAPMQAPVAQAPVATARVIEAAPLEPAPMPPALTVVEAVTAARVDRATRNPVEVDDTFYAGGDQVWAFVSIANPGEPTTVTMRWKQEGEVRWTSELTVGKSRGWRTWSYRTLRRRDVGQWQVEILDAQQNLLGTIPFEVREHPLDLEVEVEGGA